MVDVGDFCRICTKIPDEPLCFFQKNIPSTGVSFVDFLQQLTSLSFAEEDELPNIICKVCFTQIIAAHNLQQLCVNSERILREIQNKSFVDNYKIVESKDSIDDDSEHFSSECSQNEFQHRLSKKCDSGGVERPKIQLKIPPSFKCKTCRRTFTKWQYLRVHQRIHSQNRLFACKICGKGFTHEYLLRQHNFEHLVIKPNLCVICKRGCLSAESLRRHMKIHDENREHKRLTCEYCNREFRYRSTLFEHVKSHTGEKPHLCPTCGKGFRQSGALHFHQRIHSGLRPFACTTCPSRFMSRSMLRAHLRKHTDERPFACEECGTAFRQRTDLKAHQKTHSGEKSVLCTICGKRMTTTGQLTVHIRSHTGEKPFSCTRCPKAFTTKTMLVRHERIHTGERPYVCHICGKSFNQSGTLKKHANTHSKNPAVLKLEKDEIISCSNNRTAQNTDMLAEHFSVNDSAHFTVIVTAPESHSRANF